MFEFIGKIKDKYRQNRVEKLLKVQKSLNEIEDRIEELSKAQSHKYIRKEPDGKGGFNYIYEDSEKNKWIKETLGYDVKYINKKPKQYYGKHFSDSKTLELYIKDRTIDQIEDTLDHEIGHIIDYKRRGIISNPMGDSIMGYDGKHRPASFSDTYFDYAHLKREAEAIRKELPKTHSASTTQKEIWADVYKLLKRDPEKLQQIAPTLFRTVNEYLDKENLHFNKSMINNSVFTDYISELAQLKLQRNKLLKSEQSLKKEDPLFKSMYDHMRFEATYKEVTKGYRQGQISLEKCDEILKAINNDKKVRYSDNLVFNTEGKLLLLKRSELDKTFPGMYTIPGGHVDAGEDHRTAAIRELQEESGLTPNKDLQFHKIGEYEDEKCCIEYFRSDVNKDNDTLCLQSEEAWQYEWVDPRELDKYEFPLNMKQNIQKMLFPNREIIQKLGKAFKNGKITREKFIQALDVLSKSIAQIGETRHWQDGEYKKVANGKWVKIVKDKEKPVAASGITKKIKEEINLLGEKFKEERRQFNSNLLKETSYREDSVQYKVLFQRKWYEELENNSFLQKIKQDQKDLNEEILEIQKQLDIDKKSEREKIAGKKEIDFDDLNDSLKQLHNLFTDIKSKVKVFLTADKVAPTVTVNSYFLDTEASFKPVVEYEPKQGENGYIDNVAIEWNKMKESGKYEHTYSPKSSSEYLIDREKGDVYRMADHWGRCASCYWSNLWEGNYGIGVCNVKDFKRKDSGNWLNPEYRDKIVEASEISLNELKGLVNRNDIYFTEKAKERIKSFTKNIFDNELKNSAALSAEQIDQFKEKYKDLVEERYLQKSEQSDINKSEKNYDELLKKQKERRDPEGIEDDDIEEEEVEKAFSHKYISKKPDGKGGWEYEYEDKKEKTKLKKVLKSVESEIVKLKYEHGYCFDKDGNEIFNHTSHQERSIDLSAFESKLKNNIFTHNHPGNNEPSIYDIDICLFSQMKEMRSVSLDSQYGKGTYVMKNDLTEPFQMKDHVEELNKSYEDWYDNKQHTHKNGWIDVFKLSSFFEGIKNSVHFSFEKDNGEIIQL